MYVPLLQDPFHVLPLGWEDWRIMLPLSLTGFLTVELIKIVFQRVRKTRSQSRALPSGEAG